MTLFALVATACENDEMGAQSAPDAKSPSTTQTTEASPPPRDARDAPSTVTLGRAEPREGATVLEESQVEMRVQVERLVDGESKPSFIRTTDDETRKRVTVRSIEDGRIMRATVEYEARVSRLTQGDQVSERPSPLVGHVYDVQLVDRATRDIVVRYADSDPVYGVLALDPEDGLLRGATAAVARFAIARADEHEGNDDDRSDAEKTARSEATAVARPSAREIAAVELDHGPALGRTDPLRDVLPSGEVDVGRRVEVDPERAARLFDRDGNARVDSAVVSLRAAYNLPTGQRIAVFDADFELQLGGGDTMKMSLDLEGVIEVHASSGWLHRMALEGTVDTRGMSEIAGNETQMRGTGEVSMRHRATYEASSASP